MTATIRYIVYSWASHNAGIANSVPVSTKIVYIVYSWASRNAGKHKNKYHTEISQWWLAKWRQIYMMWLCICNLVGPHSWRYSGTCFGRPVSEQSPVSRDNFSITFFDLAVFDIPSFRDHLFWQTTFCGIQDGLLRLVLLYLKYSLHEMIFNPPL